MKARAAGSFPLVGFGGKSPGRGTLSPGPCGDAPSDNGDVGARDRPPDGARSRSRLSSPALQLGPAILGRRATGCPRRARPVLARATPDSTTAERSANRSAAASKRRSAPFRYGLLAWERPRSGGEDGDAHRHPPRCRSRHAEMGDSPPFFNAVEGGAVTPRRRAGRAGPCAGRVAPSHGFNGRIGIAAPLAVSQPQARQRFATYRPLSAPNGDFLSGHPQSEPDTQDLPPTSTSGRHLQASRQPYRVVMAHVAVTTIHMYNRSMEFEWDEAKNQTNIRKHGIGFDTAKRIFEGTVATSPRPSPGLRRGAPHQHRPGRARSADRGDPTERRGRIRLISARPASRKERRVYHERTLR